MARARAWLKGTAEWTGGAAVAEATRDLVLVRVVGGLDPAFEAEAERRLGAGAARVVVLTGGVMRASAMEDGSAAAYEGCCCRLEGAMVSYVMEPNCSWWP